MKGRHDTLLDSLGEPSREFRVINLAESKRIGVVSVLYAVRDSIPISIAKKLASASMVMNIPADWAAEYELAAVYVVRIIFLRETNTCDDIFFR